MTLFTKLLCVIIFSFLTGIFFSFDVYSQSTDSLNISDLIVAENNFFGKSDTLKYKEKENQRLNDSLKNDRQKLDSTKVGFTPNTGAQLEVFPSKIEDGKITVDGALDEPQWKNAVRLSNFSEVSPGDNCKPPVETETYITYDNDNIYFGYICHDDDMKNLHVTFADRDKIFQDDFAGFFIDTYSNSKQAYEFLTNPYGIQGDLLWSNGNEDESYDAVWSSGAKIFKDKWTCEIAIPFKSIRFPNKDIQDWKFHAYRIRPRKNRDEYFFCPISRDDPSLFSKAGTIKGLKNIKGGKNLEILPYILATQSRELEDFSNANSDYKNGDPNIDIGLNVKYGITSNLTTDLAINPDFSQVESDAGVININSNFALFLPEKRPFFLEGNNIFSTPYDVVYTRSINSPSLAGKITGKIGKVDVGYISAYDFKTPFLVPLDESSSVFSTRIHSLSNILRLKHDLADDSYIGLMITDREYKDTTGNFFKYNGFNRVFGLDGKLRFLEKYSFVFQLLHFNTHEINDSNLYYDPNQRFDEGKYTAGFDGESFSGTGGYLSFRRSARHWNFDVNYDFIPSTARMDNGFLSNNNFKTISSWQGYTIYPESKWIVRLEPSLFGYLKHNFQNKLREQFLQAQLYVQFQHQINMNLSMFLVNNEVVSGVYNTDALRPSINMNINTMPKFTFGFYYTRGKAIVRFLEPSYVGYTQQLQLWNTFKPLEQLSFITDYSYAELANNSNLSDKLYAGYIVRNRMSYQFSKQFFLRLITEYNSFGNSFRVDPLLSYKINPFTIFYLGSTHSIEDVPSTNSPTRFVETERQIFLKFQYLWRI